MKTRLSSTIWMLVIWTSVALFGVLGLAYEAGVHSGGASIFQGGTSGSGGMEFLLAAGVAGFSAPLLLVTLSRRVLNPIGALSFLPVRFPAGGLPAQPAGRGNPQLLIGRRRADGFHETSVQQRRSQRRSRATRS